METLYDFFAKPTDPRKYTGVQIAWPRRSRSAVVPRGDQKTRDHQLPHVQTGARRAFLRQDLRPDQGLRVQLRQIQADEAPRGDLRKMRRRGHSVQGRRERMAHIELATPVRPHLVFEEPAEQDRQPAGPDAQEHGKGPLLRQLHRHRSQGHPSCQYQLLSDEKYREALEETYGKSSRPASAPRPSRRCWRSSIWRSSTRASGEIQATGSEAKRQKLAKRLKIVDAFRRSGVETRPG
jgi:DNA-directed RNA polymerase subunit beta'